MSALTSGWDLIRSSANIDDTGENKTPINTSNDQASENLEDQIKEFSADITARAKENPLIYQAIFCDDMIPLLKLVHLCACVCQQ